MSPITIILLLAIAGSCLTLKCHLQDLKDNNKKINPKKEMCAYQPFTGPVGNIIATYKPTKLSEAVTDHSKQLLTNMGDFFGILPYVGQYISLAMKKYTEIFYEGTDSTINKLISELESQFSSLKKYVDNKAQETEYDQLKSLVRGYLNGANTCADYAKANMIKDQKGCLVALNTRMVGNVDRFMHAKDKTIAYDWSLPLFRQFADLQLVVLQDLLSIAVYQNKKPAQRIYLRRLRDLPVALCQHSKDAVKRILQVHTTFEKTIKCATKNKWSGGWMGKLQGYQSICRQTFFRGRKCKENVMVPVKTVKSGVAGRKKAQRISSNCVRGYATDVRSKIKRDLGKYWQLEILDVANQWEKISGKAKKLLKKL